LKVLRCGRLITGKGDALEDTTVLIDGSKIADVGEGNSIDVPRGAEEIDCSKMTVLPGLIDPHLHFAIGPGQNYEEQFSTPDSIQLISGVVNARCTLDSGVTTARDLGARNRVALDLRLATERGLILAPRLLVCGRSITMTGGHFHYCNAEADGYEGVRRITRQLLKEGVDFIKIMTSGGGTVGTRRDLPSYTVEEIRAAVDVAHGLGKTVTAHCHATQAIINAVDAGVDIIEHCSFLEPDGKGGVRHEFREDVAEEIAKNGIFVDNILGPTRLNPVSQERSFENFRGLRGAGAKMLPGTDGLRLFQTGLMSLALEMWVRGGASPMDAITAATEKSAAASGVGDTVGTVEKGKEADFVVVDGNPLEEIRILREPQLVIKGGRIIPPSGRVEARAELERFAGKVLPLLDELGIPRRP